MFYLKLRISNGIAILEELNIEPLFVSPKGPTTSESIPFIPKNLEAVRNGLE